jgi:hypothetical protein
MTEDGAGHLELHRRAQGESRELGEEEGEEEEEEEKEIKPTSHMSFWLEWPMVTLSNYV